MRRGYAILAAPVVSGALLLVWWAPWSSSPVPVMTRAREVFGDRPVVHVLARQGSAFRPVADGGIEIWDQGSRRSHMVVRRGGKIVTDILQGPLEPSTLWDFVTSYRSNLAAGRFRVADEERIEGRRVLWIGSPTLQVAVDPVSYQPLWIRAPGDTLLTQLVTAETIRFDPADFVLLRNRRPRHL